MPQRATGESALRSLWQHQAFAHLPLLTDGGEKIAVRFPGIPNGDAGPDFVDARIRIGRLLCRGDVELHTQSASWHAHGHDADPRYNRVILHAVLRGGRNAPRTHCGRTVPQVTLAGHIDARTIPGPPPLCAPGCRSPGMRRSPRALHRALRDLGKRKIDARVRALRTRFFQIDGERHAGSWDQLLYECLMEGMGYAKNRPPFLALARAVPIERLAMIARGDLHAAEALLFGEAGLLPAPRFIAGKESRGYVRCQRRRWRLLRGGECPRLRECDWKFFRLRPVNFPTARLAGFCRLIPLFTAGVALDRLVGPACRAGTSPRDALRAIESILAVRGEGFWSRHVHFRGRGGRVALGRERAHDLIVNTVVPLAILRARLAGDSSRGRKAFALIDALPGAARPAALREMRTRLGSGPCAGRLAGEGALRLRALYCERGRCRACPALRTSRRRSRARTWTSRRR